MIAGADVVVTSYTLFRLDADGLRRGELVGLVLDEAQFAKNHQTKVHQCARRLPAPFKLAITGTPMENNLMELWSLLSITAPGLFPSPTRFREMYARPIERDRDAEVLARLRRRIRPLVRRRTKEQVAPELPPKQEQELAVELDARHRRIYERHLQRERQKVLGLIDDVDRNRFTILRSITLLRRLSLHPGSDRRRARASWAARRSTRCWSSSPRWSTEGIGRWCSASSRASSRSSASGSTPPVSPTATSTGPVATARRSSPGSATGRPRSSSSASRPAASGMNLTEADYCFLLDPWWNPATEAQAVDRTHRIGQTRNVMVYRLIARDTIEEKVLALAKRKAALFAGVMDAGDSFGTALTADDIRALVS